MTNRPADIDVLPWVDLETFGLDATDPIIEIGVVITDLNLTTIAKRNWLVWTELHQRTLGRMRTNAQGKDDPDFVLMMHDTSGLFEEASKYGNPPWFVSQEVEQFIQRYGLVSPGVHPLCGSSVHADRQWLSAQYPHVLDFFHYRNLDVSSVKNMFAYMRPELFKLSEEKWATRESASHRALDDLEDTINELKGYLDLIPRLP